MDIFEDKEDRALFRDLEDNRQEHLQRFLLLPLRRQGQLRIPRLGQWQGEEGGNEGDRLVQCKAISGQGTLEFL